MLTQIHDNSWKHCKEHAGPVGGDVQQKDGDEEHNKCVSNGQSIDTASPPFFGGAITNLAQLAACMLLVINCKRLPIVVVM